MSLEKGLPISPQNGTRAELYKALVTIFATSLITWGATTLTIGYRKADVDDVSANLAKIEALQEWQLQTAVGIGRLEEKLDTLSRQLEAYAKQQ